LTSGVLKSLAKKMVVIGLAYGVAVLAATITIDYGSMLGSGVSLGDFLLVSAFMAMYAAPGFLVLRAVLFLVRSRNILMFGLAGAINGTVSQYWFFNGVSPEFLISGLVGGIMVWSAERLFSGGSPVFSATGSSDE